jgi:hypothetical protein
MLFGFPYKRRISLREPIIQGGAEKWENLKLMLAAL